MPAATSGPRNAPNVSSARCTPNERPSVTGLLLNEISASRGAVRMPLPARSTARTAPIAGYGRAGGEQSQLADRGEPVADAGDGLEPLPAIGRVPTDEAQYCGRSRVEPVQQTELQRVQAESEHQVERQDRGHHLGGDVGDQADHAECEDVRRYPMPLRLVGTGRRRLVGGPAAGEVHLSGRCRSGCCPVRCCPARSADWRRWCRSSTASVRRRSTGSWLSPGGPD